jgi:DNA polymerase (family 10)
MTPSLPLEANAVAVLLVEIGRRMELGGESPFKIRAYYVAAENLEVLSAPIAEYVAKGKLRTIPGVGEAIAEKIIKLHKTGTHPLLDSLREQLPAGVLELFAIPGLGPKKIQLLYSELKIQSLLELEEACKSGRLKDCKGLGAALEKKILQGLEFMRKGQGLRRIDDADAVLNAAIERFKKANSSLKRVAVAGPLRRGCEVVDDLCVVAQDGSSSTVEPPAPDIRVVVSDENHYGVKLLFATGSAEHLHALGTHAASEGFKLTADGLSYERGKKRAKGEVFCKEEADVYAALGLDFIPPELREGRALNGAKDEIELAAKHALPALVDDKDLRGILHSHTVFSDGAETLETMAEATRKRGYHYYGVADHSKSAAYAGGLKEDKIRDQHRIADGLNAKYAAEKINFRIFKGIESDILDEGALDYSDDVLKSFDFIVASVHSRFTLDKEAQTRRLLNAVAHPCTTILGHATGRLLLKREGYKVDLDAVLQACAKHGVAVEINAHPARLDIDWRYHQRALELGCMLSINPDAHAISELDLTHWGVVVARKGGVPKERVLNCMTLEQIAEHFAARKKR